MVTMIVVCEGVTQYDQTIDDCFSANDTGLCGKGLGVDFITLLNENEAVTCEQTTWPENEYFHVVVTPIVLKESKSGQEQIALGLLCNPETLTPQSSHANLV